MARLTKEKREQLENLILPLAESGFKTSDAAISVDTMKRTEFLMRKYRFATCVKILQHFGIELEFDSKKRRLPDTWEIFLEIPADNPDTEYCVCDARTEEASDLSRLAWSYLNTVLRGTDWVINYCEVLDDYLELPEEFTERAKDMIKMHAGLIFYQDFIRQHEFSKKDLEVCAKFCIEPSYEEFYCDIALDGNLILRNKKIERMLDLCSQDEKYRETPLYVEFKKLSSFILLDRRFEEFSMSCNLDKEHWCCINFVLADVIHDYEENVGLHQLNYETVILLLLADMIADEFLENHASDSLFRKGGTEREVSLSA